MSLMRGVGAAFALVLCAALAEVGGAQAETSTQLMSQTVSLPQARQLARNALSIGRPDIAEQVATQIISAYPNDVAARILLAASYTRLGKPEDGARTGRLAFRLADTPEAKFEAAYVSAEARAQAGHPMRAKLWLRTAHNHAPDAQSGAALARAYKTVSDQTPLQFGFSIAGGPSSNVNGGSLHESFSFIGISIPITQALPGYALGGSARVSYRLPGGPKDGSQNLNMTLSHRSVWLSSEAKRIDPTAKASNYTFNEIGFGYGLQALLAQGKFAFSGSANVGRRWQGGRVLGDVQRLDLDLQTQVGPRTVGGLSLGVEGAQYVDRPIANSVQWTLTASVRKSGEAGSQTTYRIGYRIAESAARGVAYRGAMASAEWQAPPMIDGIGLSVAAGVETRDYWKAPPIPQPDLRLRASVTASLQKLQRFGVVPEITVTASRSKSEIVVRDTRDLGVSFGFSSSF